MPFWISLLYCLLATLYMVLAGRVEIALAAVLKILPLLVLLAWFCRRFTDKPVGTSDISAAEVSSDISSSIVIVALGLSMLGDVILAVDGKNWFVYGLAAFLLSHIAYILALRPLQRVAKAKLGILLAGYILFAAGVLTLMAPNLGIMLLPVGLYISVILLMSLSTWHSKASNPWLIVGGLLFICSDALIGLNKFFTPIPYSGVFIMLTYYAAQYALLRGFKVVQSRTRPKVIED